MELLSPRTLKLANWTILALLVALGYLWQGPRFGLGVLVGGNINGAYFALKQVLEMCEADREADPGQCMI